MLVHPTAAVATTAAAARPRIPLLSDADWERLLDHCRGGLADGGCSSLVRSFSSTDGRVGEHVAIVALRLLAATGAPPPG